MKWIPWASSNYWGEAPWQKMRSWKFWTIWGEESQRHSRHQRRRRQPETVLRLWRSRSLRMIRHFRSEQKRHFRSKVWIKLMTRILKQVYFLLILDCSDISYSWSRLNSYPAPIYTFKHAVFHILIFSVSFKFCYLLFFMVLKIIGVAAQCLNFQLLCWYLVIELCNCKSFRSIPG